MKINGLLRLEAHEFLKEHNARALTSGRCHYCPETHTHILLKDYLCDQGDGYREIVQEVRYDDFGNPIAFLALEDEGGHVLYSHFWPYTAVA